MCGCELVVWLCVLVNVFVRFESFLYVLHAHTHETIPLFCVQYRMSWAHILHS